MWNAQSFLSGAGVETHHVALDVLVRRRVRRQRGTDHDDAVGNDRRRTVADPSDEIAGEIEIQRFKQIDGSVLSETRNGSAGLQVQRDQTESRRDRDDAFLCAILPVADTARVRASGPRLAFVLRRSPCPKRFAGARIRRNNRAARTQREIEDAVDHEGSDFRAGGPEVVELPAPCDLEILDVIAIDEIDRGITGASILRRIGKPLPVAGAFLAPAAAPDNIAGISKPENTYRSDRDILFLLISGRESLKDLSHGTPDFESMSIAGLGEGAVYDRACSHSFREA